MARPTRVPPFAMATEPLPAVGSQIGSYRVDALLGRGGMGVVYRAEDLRLGRKVALKLLVGSLADDPTYRERFLRESRLAASIEHAGIVPVFEAGEADGLLYIAMRFVDGVDLAALLRREGPLEPERAVALVGQLAGALDAAHARGLIHRDVKPSNALIGTDTDGEHAYLADFGITQDLADGDRLTATDQLVGTANYLAPERHPRRGDRPPRGHLRARVRALRVPHRIAPVRRDERGGDPLRSPPGAAPTGQRAPRRAAGGTRRGDRSRIGEGPGRALSVRRPAAGSGTAGARRCAVRARTRATEAPSVARRDGRGRDRAGGDRGAGARRRESERDARRSTRTRSASSMPRPAVSRRSTTSAARRRL